MVGENTMEATHQKESEGTIVGLCWDNGVLKQKRTTKDGKVIMEDIPHAPSKNEIKSITERFDDTETVPNSVRVINTSPLVNKAVAKEIAVLENSPDIVHQMLTQYIEKILSFHAMLIRVVGTPESLAERSEPLDIKNSALREYVLLQMNILGGPWDHVKNKIK